MMHYFSFGNYSKGVLHAFIIVFYQPLVILVRTSYLDGLNVVYSYCTVFTGSFVVRITSYNVCYTKLLRRDQGNGYGRSPFQ